MIVNKYCHYLSFVAIKTNPEAVAIGVIVEIARGNRAKKDIDGKKHSQTLKIHYFNSQIFIERQKRSQ